MNQYQQQTGQKAMSADSILAMFRNFNATMAMTEMGNYLSASTTPSCSSLQDEVVGSDDESLMSNAVHSPNGGKESPTRYRYSNVIQVSAFRSVFFFFNLLIERIVSFLATRSGRVEFATEQLEQPVEQLTASAVYIARSAQLPHGLFVADTRVTHTDTVAVSHADRIEKIGVQLPEGRRR